MQLTDKTSHWMTLPLRLAFYAFVAFLLFSALKESTVSAADPVAPSIHPLSQEPLPPTDCTLHKVINSTRAYCSDMASIRRWDLVAGKEDAQFPYSIISPKFQRTEPDKRSFDISDNKTTIAETARGVLFIRTDHVVLATPENRILSANLQVARARINAVVLPDQSVVVVGGRNAEGVWLGTTERIVHQDGQLSITALPDLPGPARTGYALVALADNRVMALGGTTSRYIGCAPCTADTYILDVRSGKWEDGPKMTEPRADASATLLPDGSVLVAGGWTPTHGWNSNAGSRTVERWHPGKNAFVRSETELVTDVAMHRTLWAAGQTGKQLLLTGGNSAAVQAYDVKSGIWRLVGEFCQGVEKGRQNVATGIANGQHFLIGSYHNGICSIERPLPSWQRIPLRLPGSAQRADLEKGVTLFRSGFSFLPGEGDAPSLVLGGSIDAGGNRYASTTAANAIWPDGRIEAWSLEQAQRWIADNAPADDPTLPPLPRMRHAGYTGYAHNPVRRKLSDGRVIVAGGLVKAHRVALLKDDSMQNDAEDEYVEIGAMVPTNTYDLFEPEMGTWRQSAPSRGRGGSVAVLDDGRIASYGQIVKAGQNDDGGEAEPPEFILEISSADGNSWNIVAMPEAPVSKLFVLQGELFVAGEGALQWFNGSTQSWETLWWANPGQNWRANVGLIIARQLSNGKRVVLPVAGL